MFLLGCGSMNMEGFSRQMPPASTETGHENFRKLMGQLETRMRDKDKRDKTRRDAFLTRVLLRLP